jgi:HlyD family secretion protein
MSASVEINTKTLDKVVSVPIQSIASREREKDKDKAEAQQVSQGNPLNDDIMEVAFVVVGDTVDMVEVRTGIQDDEYIEITTGLKEGDEVVTGPYTAVSRKLKEGMAITINNDQDKDKDKDKDKDED